MPKKYPSWIDDYGEAFRSSIQHHDVNAHMPFNGWDFYPIFADLWLDKVYSAVKAFRDKGLRMTDVIGQLPNHMSMKLKLVEIILFLKAARATPEQVRVIVDFFVEAIKARVVGEPLWINNKIHAFADVLSLSKEKKLVPANRELASEIGKIITGSATLVHGLYNDFCTDLGYDVYGPYAASGVYGEGASFLVRSFNDLNPMELWPGHTPFPFKKIHVFTVYRNVEMVPTYVACQMLCKENLVENLTYFQVEIDGKFLTSFGELKEAREKLLRVASEFYVEFMELGFEKQKELWLWQLCYQLKKLFDLAGEDWRPGQAMIDRVKNRELIPTVKSYDIPRDEFYEQFGINYLRRIYRDEL